MKITIKINGAEVVLEAQKTDEITALGPLAASILEHSQAAASKRTRNKAGTENEPSSEMAKARLRDVAWVLSTSQRPMNAPEVSAQVKDLPTFYTKGGEAIHVVRRVLAEGLQAGLFSKTAGGLFVDASAKPEPLVIKTVGVNTIDEIEATAVAHSQPYIAPPRPRTQYSPPVDDDMDDPFADN